MSLINKEVFVNALINSPLLDASQVDRMRSGWHYDAYRSNLRAQISFAINRPIDTLNRELDRESALEVLDSIRDYIADRGFLRTKDLRPWDIDTTLYDNLDQDEVWLGFEFETGWQSKEARARAVRHCWDSWDNVVFDREGEGNYPVEITFGPQELSKFNNGTADSYKFVEYMTNNPDVHQTGQMMIGCHVNISTPETRKHGHVYNSLIASALNKTIGNMPAVSTYGNVREMWFGRRFLYDGFFPGEGGTWLEGKLFRTTYDIEQFETYLHTSRVLVRCVQALHEYALEASKDAFGTFRIYIDNLLEMLEDESGIVEPVVLTAALNQRFYLSGDGSEELEDLCECDDCRRDRGEIIDDEEDEDDYYDDDEEDYDDDPGEPDTALF